METSAGVVEPVSSSCEMKSLSSELSESVPSSCIGVLSSNNIIGTVESRTSLSPAITPSSYMIWSLIFPTSYFGAPILLWINCSKIVSSAEPSIGENVSSPSNSATPAPVAVTATDISLAIDTLPNGLNPAG